MVRVKYIDNEEEEFETREGYSPYIWLTEQQAYLIRDICGDVVIPSAFVKRLKHIEVDCRP